MIGPIVAEIAEENPQYLVGKVNVDEEPELAAAFSIVSIPFLAVLRDGKIAGSAVGYRPKDAILALIKG
jgi:thioredoxin 1